MEKAREGLRFAYAPYSKYEVGAAVLTTEGNVYNGGNIENAAFGSSLCAEKVAIAKAVSSGQRNILALAVVTSTDESASLCGDCRQVISEFSSECVVVTKGDKTGFKVTTVKDILPNAFILEK